MGFEYAGAVPGGFGGGKLRLGKGFSIQRIPFYCGVFIRQPVPCNPATSSVQPGNQFRVSGLIGVAKNNPGPINLPGPDLLSLRYPALPAITAGGTLPEAQRPRSLVRLALFCGTRAFCQALPAEGRHPLRNCSSPVGAGRGGTRKNPFVVQLENLNHFHPPCRISQGQAGYTSPIPRLQANTGRKALSIVLRANWSDF